MVALEFGQVLMETGSSARNVERITGQVAAGPGAERVDARVGHASLAITISIRPDWGHPDAQSQPLECEPEALSCVASHRGANCAGRVHSSTGPART